MQSSFSRSLEIINALTRKELRVRYKSYVLGYLWSIASPLAYAAIYYFLFKLVMKVKIDNFALFLVAGMFPWQWFANSLGVAPMTFLGNASLIKKVNFPRNYLPFVVVVQDALHFLISVPVILALGLLYGTTPSATLLWALPVLLLLQFAISYPLSLLISTINLFFRDLDRLVALALTISFYLTPVVYSEAMIPPEFHDLIYWNPFAVLVLSWRHLFLDGSLDPSLLLAAIAWAIPLNAAAHLIYKRLSWKFAEVL